MDVQRQIALLFERIRVLESILKIKEQPKHNWIREEKIRDIITDSVCEVYRINLDIVRTKTRVENIRVPRQLCVYFMKSLTYYSLADIAKHVGLTDHSSSLNCIRKIQDYIDTKDDKVFTNYERIRVLINGRMDLIDKQGALSEPKAKETNKPTAIPASS